MINEELARRSKQNMSFSDYKEGSATQEYNDHMQSVRAEIDQAKGKVSEEGKERLDKLYEKHAAQYANWMNKKNANGAGHVSQMIAGPSNYNMRKHEKYLAKESKLWEEYDQIKDISWQIHSIVTSDKIIKSDDENAVEKLKEKLDKALKEHEGYKNFNKKARKEKTDPLPAYVLSNSNGRIKNIRDRIKRLERMAEIAEVTPQTEKEINGVKIVDNIAAQRLQMFFDGKPSAEVRKELKSNGFRWTPSIGAWQCYRTGYDVMGKAQRIANMI